jgi:hypothetical protein
MRVAEAAEQQDTPTAPARRWLRRTAAVLLAATPLLVSAAVPAAGTPLTAPATPRGATAAAAATGSRTVDVSVNSMTPEVPKEGDTLTLTGTLTNNGKSPITSGEVDLRLGSALTSRSAIEQTADRKGFDPNRDGGPVDGAHAKIDKLAPGVTRPFSLKVPVDDLHLGDDGVYQLAVSLSGQTPRQGYDHVLGIRRTFLPWQPDAPRKKTQLSVGWPLIASAHLTARTESDQAQTPVFRDDDLAKAIGPGGRLQQMVELGAHRPVTWIVDPDLLAAVDFMAGGYKVRKPNGHLVDGTGQDEAKAWLSSLQRAVQGEQVVALPFGDPDIASLAHHGREVPGVLGQLGRATKLSAKTVEPILHVTPSTDFAWPVQGAVDPSVVDVATSAGAHDLIARSDSIRNSQALSYTPTAARPIGGGTTAVVADYWLSTSFTSDLTSAGKSTLAVQRFLAHTLSITQQMPDKQRSIVAVPQRMPTVSQARALSDALGVLQHQGTWTEAASLSEAADTPPDPAATRSVPRAGAYPDSLRRQELPTHAFEEIQQTRESLHDFAAILSAKNRVMPPFSTAIDREMSNSWRGRPEQAADFRESVQDYLTGLTHKVKLIQKSDLTLSGRSATIPITVQNNLLQNVNGLKLELKSSRSIGLRIDDPEKRVVVDGGHSQSIKFSTTAKANGRTTVTAQLYTLQGEPYGPPMTFQVKVTSITSTVLLVIAGGVLLVVLAGVRMYTQRRRRGGPAPDPDAPLEEGGDNGDGGSAQDPPQGDGTPQDGREDRDTEDGEDDEDPPQAGDRDPDTTAGEHGRPVTSERVDR